MFRRYKYDIAFSVAEEDVAVAQQIAVRLKQKKICYYLYTEHASWGSDILRVSIETYGRQSRFVLLITSKVYAEKYWAGTENQVARVFRKREESVLPLRLDDTVIDGLSRYTIFVRWENNPDTIAAKIEEKLKERPIRWLPIVMVNIILLAGLFYLVTAMNKRADPHPKQPQPLQTGKTPEGGIDSSMQVRPERVQFREPVNPGSQKITEQQYMVLTGTVQDAETKQLIDNVRVSINGEPALTKNGKYKIALPEGAGWKKGDQINIRYNIYKEGYKVTDYSETFFRTDNGTEWNKNFDLRKIK